MTIQRENIYIIQGENREQGNRRFSCMDSLNDGEQPFGDGKKLSDYTKKMPDYLVVPNNLLLSTPTHIWRTFPFSAHSYACVKHATTLINKGLHRVSLVRLIVSFCLPCKKEIKKKEEISTVFRTENHVNCYIVFA